MAGDESRPEQARRPTLADVAAAARVSTSTASRALRDSPLVSESTRSRVRAASHGLGFEPNRLARSLRMRSSMFVGVIVPDVGIAFYARVLKSAQDVFERAGYQVLVTNSERDAGREAQSLRTLLAHRVDGVLVATSGGFAAPVGVPVIFFDQLVPGAGAGSVALANGDGIALLVGHLREHGHERIALVGAPPSETSARERLEAFRAVSGSGLVAFGDGAWSAASGEEATRELLALEQPPTAIVAAGDTLAAGAMRALRRAGRRIPEDVALVSFDDPAFGDLIEPPVTALSSHDRELGEQAASLLLRALGGESAARADIRVPVELIVRRSCGCP